MPVETVLARDLRLMHEAHDALTRNPPRSSARSEAEKILAQPEFAPRPDRSSAEEKKKTSKSFWDRFLEWLERQLHRRDRELSAPTPSFSLGFAFARVLLYVLVALIVAFLLYVLLRASLGKRGKDDVETRPLDEASAIDPMSALSRAPESWAELADQLAARGEFREAVRSLYLALLSRLHRAGAIDYDPAKSNWDYLRGFRGRGEWLAPLRELTRRFDFTYYGKLDATHEAYVAFRQLTQPLLSEPSPSTKS